MKAIAVFCGASEPTRPEYMAAAERVGSLVGQHEIHLVYGGASVGLMGKVADSCLEMGGVVTGVIPKSMEDVELAHKGLQSLIVVETMHERQKLMADFADAFIVLPGGLGTLAEMFEAATWTQLGIQQKPVGVLNVHGYYDPLKKQLEEAEDSGFLSSGGNVLLFEERPIELLEALELWEAPAARYGLATPEQA